MRFTEVISHLAVSIVIEGEPHSLSESIAFRKVSCQCEFQLQIENSNKSKMNFLVYSEIEKVLVYMI